MIPALAFAVAAAASLPNSAAAASLREVAAAIRNQSPSAADMVRQLASVDKLMEGIPPVQDGLQVFFALTTSEANASVQLGPERTVALTKVDERLFAGVVTLAHGDGFRAVYLAGGKPLPGGHNVEAYAPNLNLSPAPAEKAGELRDMGLLTSTHYPGTTRRWHLYIPRGAKPGEPLPLLVGLDAQWDRNWMRHHLDNLIAAGKILPTAAIMIEPGSTPERELANRNREYDTLSPLFAQFLEEAVIPEAEKVVSISRDPKMRAIAGMSSGGACNFTICWERPDLFGTALSFIGSYTNLAPGQNGEAGAHTYPAKIRRQERKPIRVWLQDGENDLNNQFGSWWLANLEMKKALEFSGYEFVWSPGKGFHSSRQAQHTFDQALIWWIGN